MTTLPLKRRTMRTDSYCPANNRIAESISGHKLPRILFMALTLLAFASAAFGQQPYQKPPKAIEDVLNAPSTPTLSLSPNREYGLLTVAARYPPISEISQPMLRLAGIRINPATNGPHLAPHLISYTIKKISDGSEIKVAVPPNPRLGLPEWSPDGQHFAFTNTTESGIELWIGTTKTGAAHRVTGVKINAVHGQPLQWLSDNRTMLIQEVPHRGAPPAAPTVPIGPTIQQSTGKAAPVRTYEDMLANPHDEDVFEYYATAQLALLDTTAGTVKPLGKPAIFDRIVAAPDGNHILVARVHRPFSYLYPVQFFPKELEVWDRTGKVDYKMASLPLEDHTPINGVTTGPRGYGWRPTEPATLVWIEALDGGNPKTKVDHRDKIMLLAAPFTGAAKVLFQTEQRFGGIEWGEKNGLALVTDNERIRRTTRTFIINADRPEEAPRLMFERNNQDNYRNPGRPLIHALPNGHHTVLQNGDDIFMLGMGASPEGERPFLDRLNLKTLKTERLFRCDTESYEQVIALLNEDGSKFLTRRETPTEPPNYYIRTSSDAAGKVALTQFSDPTPQLRNISKQLVKYQRADGVPLSFTLYLPPDYKPGTRLPTVVWAYPMEFNDAATAGQVSGTTKRFTSIGGASQLFYVLAGYAVLDNASMPIVGDSPESVNNSFVDQIVMNAQAAIDKAVEMGVTDRDRVGVGGHSYGAFMTANLLAHTRLFRAGVARSGAYNRTLTPFGFQSEPRTYWEATDLYTKMSPFSYADKIKDPILMIHGEADDNQGTFPIQSERMFEAVRGNGGTARLVLLPDEAHGYSARESIEHTLFEMITWFDEYVKQAEPRAKGAADGGKQK